MAINSEKITLLGGSDESVQRFLEAKLRKLEGLFDELDALDDAQVQLYLVARSMSICRVTYYMRCLPPSDSLRAFLTAYSNRLRLSLANLLNRDELPDRAWRQAKLKHSEAGLGLGDPLLTVDAAFISSVSSTMQLSLGFLGRVEDGEHGVADATLFEPTLAATVERYNATLPDAAARYDARNLPYGLKQEALSTPLVEAEYAAFEATFANMPPAEGEPHIARLRSCRAPESSAWLVAVPNDRFKTKMSQESFRVAVELRLGILRSEGDGARSTVAVPSSTLAALTPRLARPLVSLRFAMIISRKL